MSDYKSQETVRDILKMDSGDWLERGLRKETLERFGVKVAHNPIEGPLGNPTAIYFPYRNKDGSKICGYKKKDLTKDKDESGHFSVIGRVDVSCQLFAEKESRKMAKKLIIAEGCVDMLSIYQSLCDSVKGTEFERYTPAVVSIHLGCPNALKSIVNREEFVSGYKEVVLAMDRDERGPLDKANVIRGKEATEMIGCHLTKQKVSVVQFPDYVNDANDMLMKGKSKQLANLIKFDTVVFKADKILGVEDIDFEELIKPKEKGVYLKSFPKLMDRLLGIRKSEISVLTSLSSVGKSYVVSEIAYNLAEQEDEKVALIFLEETVQESLRRMIARRLNKNYYKFQYDPIKFATKAEIKEAYDWCIDKFYFVDAFGGIPIAKLMDLIKNLTFVIGCGYVVLDHLSFLMTTLAQNVDERRAMDALMTELASFVAKTDVGIFAVSHLNGKASEEIGKLSDIKEPKWICVKKENMKGSRSIEQAAFNVLGLDFQMLPNKERGDVRITCLKTRNGASIGDCDVFQMGQEDGLIKLVEEEMGGY